MENYTKLNEPQLIELDSELGFVIATHVDFSLIKNGVIIFKGESYDYENGKVQKQHDKEVRFDVIQNCYYNLDDKGKVID